MISKQAVYEYVARMSDGIRDNYRAAILHTNGAKVPSNADRYTGHAWDANHWTVGIETEDDGDPATPWTALQLDAIVALLKELQIPAQLLKETRSEGLGWHRQYDSWNKSNHSCPGDVRRDQIKAVVLPKLKGDDMDAAEVKLIIQKYLEASQPEARDNENFVTGIRRFLLNQARPSDASGQAEGWDFA